MIYIYHLIFYQPLLNSLVFLYQTVAARDLGIAIILLTILIRLLLFPLFQKSVYHQMVMQKIQPEVKRLQEKYKSDYQKQTQEIMAVYRNHKINPLSGIFLVILQLPVLIALYQISITAAKPDSIYGLYSFIPFVSGGISPWFLGLVNLAEPSAVITGIAAAAQYFQGRFSLPKNQNPTAAAPERLGHTMVWLAPLITLMVLWNLPAAVGLYWLSTSVFSVFQQSLVNRRLGYGKNIGLSE